MKIFVSGSLAFDKIMDFPGCFKDHILPDKIHNLNVSFTIKEIKENFGGTAGNISYNLALLGERPIIFAAAGGDFKDYNKWLKNHGVDTSKIRVIEGERTASCYITTDGADNQIAAFHLGAIKYSCDIDFSDIKKYLTGENQMAIIAPGSVKDTVNLANIYKGHHIPYIFDPGQSIPILSEKNLRDNIDGAKVFISNDYELSLILKKTGWSESELLEKAEIVVTTLGKEGSAIRTKNKKYMIKPAKPKNAVDPTGAGDAYRAGFIKGLINNWPLETTGRFAGVVACYTVEKYGTQTHHFSFEEAKRRYKENFGEELPE